MPLPPAHGLFGLAAAYCLRSKSDATPESRFILGAAFLSVLPDFDIAAGLAWAEKPWIFHRGPSHSFVMIGITALLIVCLFHARRMVAWRELLERYILYAGVLLSHSLLDSVWPRYGVMLYWPFSDRFVFGPHLPFVDYIYSLESELFFEFFLGGSALFIALALNWKRLGMRERIAGLFPAVEEIRGEAD